MEAQPDFRDLLKLFSAHNVDYMVGLRAKEKVKIFDNGPLIPLKYFIGGLYRNFCGL